MWRAVSYLVRRPAVLRWLMRRGAANPYTHITSADGSDTYMRRFWVFNPYGKTPEGEVTPPRWTWLPSIRLHHILRPDQDRDLHDHPWNARTIILAGYYHEIRPLDVGARKTEELGGYYIRTEGYTGRLLFGQYHRIAQVPPDGVWTLFFTWRKRGTWGFLVDGKKVPWRDYLADR